MKQIILVVTIILMSILGFGQDRHLEPAKHYYQSPSVVKEYYKHVFEYIYQGYSEKPMARYTAMPSFTSEYSFSLETAAGKNYVLCNAMSENYWYAKNKDKVELVSNKAELDNDLYLKIAELFKLLEEQTRKPEDQLIFKTDGTIYYFTTTDQSGQQKIGETWSPLPNSLIGNVVKVCDHIYQLGNGENLSQTEISNEIDKLLHELIQ